MAAKKKAKKTPAKIGRPTKYSKALATKLCAMLSAGDSLKRSCELKSFPSITTVFRWIASNDAFRDMYEKAVEQRVEVHIEGLIDIADDPSLHPQDKRVRIDTRKWIASKLKHRKYGDKVEVSGNPDQPQIVKIQHELV